MLTNDAFPLTMMVRKNILTERCMMITARVTSKGQVTIPKEVRERLGVREGEDIGFEEREGLFVVSKVVTVSPFDKWVGKLKHLKGKRSDDLVREARGHDHSR
ncbi:MAG: AbrB/MazE/SpoVT family DNA-binding domain-containing protein [Smithellaceae bacterium]